MKYSVFILLFILIGCLSNENTSPTPDKINLEEVKYKEWLNDTLDEINNWVEYKDSFIKNRSIDIANDSLLLTIETEYYYSKFNLEYLPSNIPIEIERIIDVLNDNGELINKNFNFKCTYRILFFPSFIYRFEFESRYEYDNVIIDYGDEIYEYTIRKGDLKGKIKLK